MANWRMLPAEIHNKIYDIVDTMNSFDVAEHNRITENLIHQFSTCAYYTRGLEEEDTDSVKPSLVIKFVLHRSRPTNCWRCMYCATLCLQCEIQAQWACMS